ncbi:methyl-accepting chemotaxis protein [Micavibrio aeruginosavorus]|uniref:methyl-accepting chemotaxis protein n=1 Tax=Micavibrio aeruginosavorus TaxID=349221 RepID=UPI003F4AF700
MRFLSNLKIKTKILMIIVLAVLGNLAIVYANANTTRTMLQNERTLKTRHLTETAYTLIEKSYADFQAGSVTEDEAKTAVLETLKSLRYETSDYFWINTPEPRVVMHPMIPKIVGQDLAKENPKLHTLFSEMSVAAKSTDKGGAYNYLWQKPGFDQDQLFPKVSYVKYFAPWNWVVGTGIYVDDVQAAFRQNLIEGLINAGIVVAVIILLSMLISTDLSKPMKKLSHDLKELASGNINVESEYGGRKDEVGDIARAFNVFKQNTIEKYRLEAEQKENERRQAEEKKALMLEMANTFDERVGKIVDSVGHAASDLQMMAGSLSSAIEETTQQSQHVSESSSRASSNVATVAAATEELSVSIQEISSNILTTSSAARACASNAELSQAKLDSLQAAISEIDQVVQTINAVAEQTNLLALNATIEASRAGEAGKGFSVVASEVKTLANQTRNMTNEISTRVEHVKNSALEAVETVKAIISGVNEVDGQTAHIAAAVEEQTTATQEISRNIQIASDSTNTVSTSIEEVKVATEHSAQSTSQLKESSDMLAMQADMLKKSVNEFLDQIRNG